MPESTPTTIRVAPNGVNNIVIPTVRAVPMPPQLAGDGHISEDNPSLALHLPNLPEGRISLGVGGRPIPERRFAIQGQAVYAAVPPLPRESVTGRISYLTGGTLQLLTFEVRRAETVTSLIDSLQAQFDNMTAFVEALTGLDTDERAFMREQAWGIQARLVNALELRAGWSSEEYADLHERSNAVRYTTVKTS